MDPQVAPIKQDIDDIRESLVGKLEAIEGLVKDTVDDTVEKVKDTVDDTVEAVRRTFDIKQQVGDHPWAALGVAVVAGYVLGSVGGDDANGPSYRFANTSADAQQPAASRGFLGDFMDQFSDELDTIKTAAIASVASMIRETMRDVVPGFGSAYAQAQRGQANSSTPTINPVRP